ncbi:hypothetical protein L198_01740 [Cryptococcus wingfieldii CBS 7118]|uniref:Uncharacterized protein n=1 Tax=Cryptococcus wingfieldii CBS 7118 TaxID=1295528 RepID=A0A1E3K236_9TREE|nr:hypothetical protein L198_01740 [Cryptococcus wingfieldii CBS 7118]ODO06507.1 hypothetical protein L198_01740 [Cryptococcus wingfieldii CBS 7118]
MEKVPPTISSRIVPSPYITSHVTLATELQLQQVLFSCATRNRRDPLATPFAASPAPSKPHAPTLSSLLKDRPKLLASVEKSSRAVRSFESTDALRRMWCARETWAEDRYKLLLDEGDVEAAVNVLTSLDFAESEQGDGNDVHEEDSESDDE